MFSVMGCTVERPPVSGLRRFANASCGKAVLMPETPKELVHDVVEEVKELEHEAEAGESARTPLIVLSGVMVFVWVIVAVVLALAFLAYYLT
jgi:hypothetical protein